MSEQNENDQQMKGLLAYCSSAYFFSVAALYLWGYWSPFKINIFEYISLSDAIKITAYPIASLLILIAIGMLMSDILLPNGFISEATISALKKKKLYSLTRHTPSIYILATLTFMLIGPVSKWKIIPVLIAIPISATLKELGILKNLIKSERNRTTVLFLLSFLPPTAYGQGTLRANDIISGKAYTYVASDLPEHKATLGSSTGLLLRYVGKAGDQYFLYNSAAKSLVIISMSKAEYLELKTFEKQDDTELNKPTPSSTSTVPSEDRPNQSKPSP